MTLSPAARVGILVLLAVAVLAGVFLFLKGYTFSRNKYSVRVTFDNALGIMPGAEVRMAGVTIGQVSSVTLNDDQRAKVVLDINRKYRIPEGSQFALQSGILISQQLIEVIPNRESSRFMSDGATVEGVIPARLEDMMPKAQEVLENLADATASLKEMMGDERLNAGIAQSVANIACATGELNAIMASAGQTVVRSQEDIDAIMSSLRSAGQSVRGMTAELESFVAEGVMQGDLRDTTASARRSAETLERVVSSLERSALGVESLMTDPKFHEDIRQTVAETRAAVGEARETIDRVNRVFSAKRPSFKSPAEGVDLDVLYLPGDDRLRAELTTRVPLRGDDYIRLGLYDVGAGNRLILQGAKPLNSRTDLRYGFYSSKLGLGLDRRFSGMTFGSLDLYGAEHIRLDAKAGYRLNDDWSVLLGVDELLGANRAGLGVRLTR